MQGFIPHINLIDPYHLIIIIIIIEINNHSTYRIIFYGLKMGIKVICDPTRKY